MKRRTELMSVFIICALILGFAGRAGAVKYLWQVALEEIEGSMQHEYAKKFAEIVEEKSKGEIHCNIHFYGRLGTSGEITELLQKGDLLHKRRHTMQDPPVLHPIHQVVL